MLQARVAAGRCDTHPWPGHVFQALGNQLRMHVMLFSVRSHSGTLALKTEDFSKKSVVLEKPQKWI